MQSQNPITVDDITYDKLTISLAVSNRYSASGDSTLSIALRAVPTAITEEGVKTLDSQAHTVYRGRLEELRTDDEKACVETMSAVLIAYIHEQGW
jgi:hypothetical protein